MRRSMGFGWVSGFLFLNSTLGLAGPTGTLKFPTHVNMRRVFQTFSHIHGSTLGVKKDLKSGSALDHVKESMARFLCPNLDSTLELEPARDAALIYRDLYEAGSNIQDDPQFEKFKNQLPLLMDDPSLEIYAGSVIGKDVSGQVLGIYDLRNHEVIYLGFSHCGSDE